MFWRIVEGELESALGLEDRICRHYCWVVEKWRGSLLRHSFCNSVGSLFMKAEIEEGESEWDLYGQFESIDDHFIALRKVMHYVSGFVIKGSWIVRMDVLEWDMMNVGQFVERRDGTEGIGRFMLVQFMMPRRSFLGNRRRLFHQWRKYKLICFGVWIQLYSKWYAWNMRDKCGWTEWFLRCLVKSKWIWVHGGEWGITGVIGW